MDSSINCQKDDARQIDYIAGELDGPELDQLEQHLAACAACREQVAQLRAVGDVIASAAAIEPPEGFVEHIVNSAKLRDGDEPDLADHAPDDGARLPHRPEHRQRFGTKLPEPRFALSKPIRFSRIAIYAAAGILLLMLYLGDDTPQGPKVKPRVVSPKLAQMQVVKPPDAGINGGNNLAGDLLDYPSDWLPRRIALDEPIIDPILILPPDDALASTPRGPDPDLPDIMDDLPTNIIPAPTFQLIQPNYQPGVFLARTSRRHKAHYLRHIGGDAGSMGAERAIARALYWLAKHQDSDGKWDINDPKHPGTSDSEIDNVGLTAAAVLAFLGDGHTPIDGRYRSACAKGTRWLIEQQRKDGCIGTRGRGPNHSLAAIALAEAYGMTLDEQFAAPARNAVAFVLSARGGTGKVTGRPRNDAFEMIALRTGELAGLEVPPGAAQAIRLAIAEVPHTDAYGSPQKARHNAVSGKMLSAMYLDTPDAPESDIRSVVQQLVNNYPQWKNGDMYYWFCGTTVMRQWLDLAIGQYHNGHKAKARDMVKAWKGWNEALRKTLIENQTAKGNQRGSWEPKGPFCRKGGRTLATALSALTLESYYRYLPPEK